MTTKAEGFRFPKAVRKHVKALADLLYYANSRDDGRWADMCSVKEGRGNGVYGHAYNCIRAIIREECGEAVAKEWGDAFELGASTPVDDVESAVEIVLEKIREDAAAAEDEERRRCEDMGPPVKA